MRPPPLFRALLCFYPASFRADYGRELARVYADHRRDASGPWAHFALWWVMALDSVVTGLGCHWDILKQDLGYAARTLRKAPSFTLTVILVMALGIGANTAAFTLADHVLLRPLPFSQASELVALWQSRFGAGVFELSPANFRDWEAESTSFSGMAATTSVSANLVGEGEPERLEGASVTADLLSVLGVRPLLGRDFTPEDDVEGAPGTVLLSHGLWKRHFGGDPGVLGRTLRLDDETYTVIGVMPPQFAFPARTAEFWRTMRFPVAIYEDRTNVFLRVVARLRPGASVASAKAELDVINERIERAAPKEHTGIRAVARPLREEMSQQARVLVLALSGAAFCVLLIACLNIANLLLARAAGRQRELTVRTALGAGRGRLIRQLVTESLLLALGGGALGVALAVGVLPLLTQLVPGTLPIVATPEMDVRVLAVAAGLTVLAGLVFGVGPSLRACRDVDAQTLREGPKTTLSGRKARLFRAVVVAEICASLTLLVSAGLLLRALWNVQERDPGFTSEGVLTARTWLPLPKYEKTMERDRFYDRVLTELRAQPGVTGAAYTSFLPMVMGGGIWRIALADRELAENEPRNASVRFITPGYFSVMKIPLHAGRDVSDTDAQDRPYVAVVSEAFAKRFWPGEDPLGKRFTAALEERVVVGVVSDVRVRGLERESEPQVYLPHMQVKDGWLAFYAPKDLVVRTSGEPMALVPALRRIVQSVDPQQPLSNVLPLEEVVSAQTSPRRVQLLLIGIFATLAFVLAGIGIYGLLSFAVSNRRQEIGVRLAMGATPRSILSIILREGAALALGGAALGVALAYVAGRSLEALLVGVTPADIPTFAGALAIVLVVALLGSGVPAWRAARVDPASAMRAE